MIAYTHSVSLVIASIVVSMVAAITALALMNNIRTLPDAKRKALIVMAAFVLGGGIWSMHFLAMLSLQFPVPIHYDLLQTLSSGLIAVLVVGAALLLLHFRPRTRATLNLAGVSLGIGILAMHFIGMLGMRGVIATFNDIVVIASLIVALVMGVAAVRVSYGSRSRQNIVKGGFVFGFSVVVVHFTAMTGTCFSVDSNYSQLTVAFNQDALAIVVTVAAFMICGTFLLAASTFVSADQSVTIERADSPADTGLLPSMVSGFRGEPLQRASESLKVSVEANSPVSPKTGIDVDSAEGLEKSADANLTENQEQRQQINVARLSGKDTGENAVGKKAHHPQQSQHSQSSQHSQEDTEHRPEQTVRTQLPVRIPFEERKQIAFVSSDEVGVLRADGRYTQVYTQAGVKFCPWSISEAESRLTDVGFFRSHRSYLINIAKVDGFEKKREAGICRFTGFANLDGVPVSRTRVTDIVKKLGL